MRMTFALAGPDDMTDKPPAPVVPPGLLPPQPVERLEPRANEPAIQQEMEREIPGILSWLSGIGAVDVDGVAPYDVSVALSSDAAWRPEQRPEPAAGQKTPQQKTPERSFENAKE
jgi:hypothetical protein